METTSEIQGGFSEQAGKNHYGTAWNFEESVSHQPGSGELRYTFHAVERALERKLPILRVLPAEARLADRDSGAIVCKIPTDKGGYFLLVSEENSVITLFAKDDAEWKRWTEAKARFQRKENRLESYLFAGEQERWEPMADTVYQCARYAALHPVVRMNRRSQERRRCNTGNPKRGHARRAARA